MVENKCVVIWRVWYWGGIFHIVTMVSKKRVENSFKNVEKCGILKKEIENN
jgi:hypothetical protein